ncbi:D-alanyl-D-alanine carboxypeptidase/D-alanyl-D-alanine endopeptidase [Methylovorus mays]|uniref:D-alanyl-D-alanine carboxypeptidase/D-alanyl-D-alanine endopeptidase n=1 Tax=Methylovorus mays TaxID=184077 RepID=UPI001E4472A8|nr:D-alanyl-D-alanine carboxypeptidase/D-alanyl-D-alanine-endopeptidase [Methylovorus mays]MCB5205830.1 D-alanyl-D-alanine carboxypeptidase/D-alanyl-D-alanine-endopeptidase [Methylovorus mays]
MLRRLLFCCVLGLAVPAHAVLPLPVSQALQQAGLADDDVAVYAQRLDLPLPVIAHRADAALNPASTMKLLTTYAALDMLGPAYRWRTEIYRDGPLVDGVLQGNLILRGEGDPALMAEDFWRLLSRLRQLGVREITGDLIIDNSYFAPQAQDAAAFDGDGYRAYNVTASALVINLQASSLRLAVSADSPARVEVSAEPALPGVVVQNRLQVTRDSCGDWRSRLQYKVQPKVEPQAANAPVRGVSITLSGTFSADCGEKYLELSVLDGPQYTYQLFQSLWQSLGGSLHGEVRLQALPPQAVKITEQLSPLPLADVLRRLNKYSNNLMARQLLLTVAAQQGSLPATEEAGANAVRQWLAKKGYRFPELMIENGAGLSRVERISPRHLGMVLADAYAGPWMPELMSSLPVLGVDGTLLKRMQGQPVQGRAHLKTGSLNGVSSVAGYVLDQHGQRWLMVFMVNHPRAAASRAAQDALIGWIYRHDE